MCGSSLSLSEFLDQHADAERGQGNAVNADLFTQRAEEAREQEREIYRLQQENSRLQTKLDNFNRAFKAA